jgi:formate dehydrogenase assembly factor FdhD
VAVTMRTPGNDLELAAGFLVFGKASQLRSLALLAEDRRSALLNNLTPLKNSLMLVSGRASFELVQKALMAGIPLLAAVGVPVQSCRFGG